MERQCVWPKGSRFPLSELHLKEKSEFTALEGRGLDTQCPQEEDWYMDVISSPAPCCFMDDLGILASQVKDHKRSPGPEYFPDNGNSVLVQLSSKLGRVGIRCSGRCGV